MEKKRIDFTFDDQSLQPRKQFEALQHDAKLSNLLPAQAGSFHAGRWPAEAHWTVRVYKPGYFALRPSGSATSAPTLRANPQGLFLKHFTYQRSA